MSAFRGGMLTLFRLGAWTSGTRGAVRSFKIFSNAVKTFKTVSVSVQAIAGAINGLLSTEDQIYELTARKTYKVEANQNSGVEINGFRLPSLDFQTSFAPGGRITATVKEGAHVEVNYLKDNEFINRQLSTLNRAEDAAGALQYYYQSVKEIKTSNNTLQVGMNPRNDASLQELGSQLESHDFSFKTSRVNEFRIDVTIRHTKINNRRNLRNLKRAYKKMGYSVKTNKAK